MGYAPHLESLSLLKWVASHLHAGLRQPRSSSSIFVRPTFRGFLQQVHLPLAGRLPVFDDAFYHRVVYRSKRDDT